MTLVNLGNGPRGDSTFDREVFNMLRALDKAAPACRCEMALSFSDRVEAADQMVRGLADVRVALQDFLTRWVDDAEGWIGALSDREKSDFERDPFEMLGIVQDRFEGFVAEHSTEVAA